MHVHTRCRVILVAKNDLTTYQNMKNNKLLLNSQMNSESCDSQSSYTAMHMRSSEYITLITIMMINNNNYYHYCYCISIIIIIITSNILLLLLLLLLLSLSILRLLLSS